MLPKLLAVLPNLRVCEKTLSQLERHFAVDPSDMGERSSYDSFRQRLLLGYAEDSPETQEQRRDRKKRIADYHNCGGEPVYVMSVSGAHPEAHEPDKHITQKLLRAAALHRRVRNCLAAIQPGAYAALASLFEPQRFDTVCTDRLDGSVDIKQGPIDRKLGRFAFIAMHTPMAGEWMQAETVRTGWRCDSALPFVRDVCTKGNKARFNALLADVEAVTQAAFDQFEQATKQYFERIVKRGKRRAE